LVLRSLNHPELSPESGANTLCPAQTTGRSMKLSTDLRQRGKGLARGHLAMATRGAGSDGAMARTLLRIDDTPTESYSPLGRDKDSYSDKSSQLLRRATRRTVISPGGMRRARVASAMRAAAKADQ
jgi:hypothetical protein